ncbi:MAG: hypothetical protein AAFX99_00615 [Myxococcota bacterium]
MTVPNLDSVILDAIRQLSTRFDGVETQLKTLTDRVDNLTDRVGNLTDRVDNLTGRVELLEKGQSALLRRFDRFETQIDMRFRNIEDDVAQFKDWHVSYIHHSRRQDERVGRIEERLTKLREEFDATRT